MRIVLIGAGGFLGRYVLYALLHDRHHCVVLSRAPASHGATRLLPGVELVQADVYDPEVLAEQFTGADVIISMAGILNETGHKGQGFYRVHVGIVEAVIEACRLAGVSRVLHVSALNAGQGSSYYLKTKGQAEALLMAAKGLNVSIFQPSVIFAPGDEFFNRFAAMLRVLPVLPLACAGARLQPVFAGDVAAAMCAALDDPMTWGKRYQLAGPKSYTLKELVQWTTHQLNRRRSIIGLPRWLSAVMGLVMEWVPGKPFSRDNYRSLQTDNTARQNGFAYFGIYPRTIDTIVPDYLTSSVRQRRLQGFRRQARR